MAGNLKPSFRNVGPQTGGHQKCWQGSSCQSRSAGPGSRSWGQGVPARAAPSPLNLPSTDGSQGAREENVSEEWKQESRSLCSHSAKNWSSSRHLSVLSRRRVFISCHRWPWSSLQAENGCAQDVPVGSFQPLSGQEMVGGHQPALQAQLTAGLSAPSHASTFTLGDGLDMDFKHSTTRVQISPLDSISYPTWLH